METLSFYKHHLRFLDAVLIGICSAHINEMSQEGSSLLSCLGSPRKLIHGLGEALPSPTSLDSIFFSFCWIWCMFRPHIKEMWGILTIYSGWKDADAIVTRKASLQMGQDCCLVVLIWADILNRRGWSKMTLSPYTQSTEVAEALTKINLSYFNYDSLPSLFLPSSSLTYTVWTGNCRFSSTYD